MDAGRLVIPDSAGIWQAMWDQSNALHRQSNGAFDVTVEPWMRLWGFRGEHVDQVTQQQVDSVHWHVRGVEWVGLFKPNVLSPRDLPC